MFQKNLDYHHNTQYRNFILKLRNQIIHDPVFESYVESLRDPDDNAKLTDRQLSSYFSAFVASIENPEIKKSFQDANNMLYQLNEFEDGTFSSNKPYSDKPGTGEYNWIISQKWNDIVYNINLISGFEAAKRHEALKFETEVYKKTKNNILETIHEQFSNDGYNEMYKDNPKGNLIMHMGHVLNGFMTELSEFAMEANVANFKEGYLKDITNDTLSPEKNFVAEMNTLKDKMTFAPEQSIQDIVKNEDSFNEYLEFFEKKKKELEVKKAIKDENLRKQLLADENVKKEIEDKANEIWLDLTTKNPSDVEKQVQDLREEYAQTNREIEERNKEIERFNRECDINNEKIYAEIKEIEDGRNAELSEIDKIDPEIIEKNEREEWEKAKKDAEPKLSALDEERITLEKQLAYVKDGIEAGMRTNLVKYYNIPDSHFSAVEAEENNVKYFNEVTQDLYDIGGHERYAKGLFDSITPEIREKHAKLREKHEMYQKKINDLSKVAKPDTKKIVELNAALANVHVELEDLGPQGKALSAIADWKNKYKDHDIVKEFDALKKNEPKENGRNDYELLTALSKSHEEKGKELKNEYKEYYKDLATFKDYQKNGKQFDADKITDRLHEIKIQSQELNEIVSEEKFNARLAEKLKGCKSKEEIKAMRDEVNKKADAQVAEKNSHIMVKDELEKKLSQETIEAAVTKRRNDITKVYNATWKAETNKLLVPASKLIVDNAMTRYREDILDKQNKLNHDKVAVEDIRDKAKRIYDDAVRINNSIPKLTEMWKSTNPDADSPIAGVENTFKEFEANIDNGKSNGHKDSKEFEDMKKGLVGFNKWIETNQKGLRNGDKGTCKIFKEMLKSIKDLSQDYIDKKQEGIHLIPSRMRFVRLKFAEELRNFCDVAAEKADKNIAVLAQREEMTKDVESFVKNVHPIKDFPNFKDYIFACEKRYGKDVEKENTEVKEKVEEKLIDTEKVDEKEIDKKYGKDAEKENTEVKEKVEEKFIDIEKVDEKESVIDTSVINEDELINTDKQEDSIIMM